MIDDAQIKENKMSFYRTLEVLFERSLLRSRDTMFCWVICGLTCQHNYQ
jgi:hypothetical protein